MGRGRPHKCPYCGASKSVAKGFRYNKAGMVRLRRCLACRRRWTAGPKPGNQKAERAEEPINATAVGVSKAAPPGEESESGDAGAEKDVELTLSGEVGPSHKDPGGEERKEGETDWIQESNQLILQCNINLPLVS